MGRISDKIRKYIEENLQIKHYEEVCYSSFTLEEARRLYDWEEDRRKTVANKTGILIGVDALIISLIAGFNLSGTMVDISVLAAIISVVFGSIILGNRKYERPVEHDDIYPLSEKPEYDSKRMVLRNYRASLKWNSWINRINFDLFNMCLASTFSSIIVLGLSLII